MSDELNHVTPDDENPAAADETSPVTPVEVAAEPEAEPVAVPAPAPAPAMTTPAPSFWKPIHGIIGLGLLLAIVFLVRGCGGEDAENQEPVTKAKVEETKFAPVQPAVIQVPVPVPVPVPAPLPKTGGAGNKWIAPGSQNTQTNTLPEWGKSYQSGPLYTQPRPDSHFRPLTETKKAAPTSRSAAPAASWPTPYDRPDGSSFGATENRPAYPGAYAPGYPNTGYPNARYPGAAPYGYPGVYGGGYPGGYGGGHPLAPGLGVPHWY